jgi:thiamine-phosphate pyrophosphorylase
MLFLTDSARVEDPLAVARSLPAGAGIILRDYDSATRNRLAADLSAICRQKYLLFLVAGDERLAQKVGAHGIHQPEHAISQIAPIRRRHPDWWITASAHSGPAARKAHLAGADAVLVSPVFSTLSHPGAATLGVRRLAQIAGVAGLPAFALGGIDVHNVHRLRGSGASGIAAIGGLATQNGQIKQKSWG